ncbi:MAG: hypothetical protein C0404_12125, partial [Verrucomicrobia bacterium]|nr:hypothetical protein [Verrucomicrobiota bacterium]
MMALAAMAWMVPVQPAAGSGVTTLVQDHYRWRNDDAGESAATWKANADTAITGVARGQNIRLRFSVSNTGTASGTVAARLEYSTSTSGPWTAVGTDGSGVPAFEMAATANYANGAATTALLAGAGGYAAGKCVESPSNTSATVTVGTNQYSNFEYCVLPTAKARGSTTYYFRTSNSGTALTTYSKYAQLTMAAGEANEAPVIRSALTANASVVAPFSHTILASGSEPITYGAGGLPAGLTLSGNTVTGTPAVAGTFSVGLTASNTWGRDSKTLALTVFANQPPAASNQAANIVEAGEVLIYLAWSDPDTPLKTDHTFTILSGPSKGTLQSYNSRNKTTVYPDYWYYRAGVGTGVDSFTWKCRDKASDSNVATCSINVTANTAPVANNSSVSVNSGTQGGCSLSATHADAGQTMTYTTMSGPSHGTLAPNPASSYWYYTSAKDYVGGDSFTWRVNDGVTNSGVATVTITVNACAPVPQSQTAVARKDTATDIPASYTGGGGYSYYVSKLTSPSHGSLAISGMTFRYTPAAGYTGPDSFRWRLCYNSTSWTSEATCTIVTKEAPAVSNEWPQFRANEFRDAMTLDELPSNLYLQWRRDLPAGRPIVRIDSRDTRVCAIDPAYMPVIMGQTMFVGFNRNDCVAAYDTRTGAEKWRFLMNGPVRVAPVAFRQGEERVCVGSDDGWTYCLGAADGTLRWKVRCGPNERKMIGEGRMISVWPIRAAPTFRALSADSGQDGRIVFAGGVWPAEGCFLWAVDGGTGAKIWRNDRLGTLASCISAKSCGGTGAWGLHGLMPSGYPVACSYYGGEFFLTSAGSLQYQRFSFADGRWASEDPGHDRDTTWRLSANGTEWASSACAVVGSRSFTSSDVASLGVVGTVDNVLAADNRLFAVTTQGSIYCFGGTQVETPAAYLNSVTPLAAVSDQWTTDLAAIISATGVNDTGIGMVWGLGTGRAMEELVKQSQLHVIGVDGNASTVSAMRTKLQNAGLYGERCAVLESDPMAMDVPPYQA